MISVVVCTYNRAELLRDVLETLLQQSVDDANYEIIVIDNNSNDATSDVVREFSQNNRNLRYVFEGIQGLSNARNRGWRESFGEYVAYLDDDCKAPDQWLSTALLVIDRDAPDVFGGPYYAFYHSTKPHWWKDSYRSIEHAETARELQEGEYLSGGNIIFRRELLEDLGGFDPRYGMTGDKLAFGEETILLKKMRRDYPNIKVIYDPALYVYHLVHEDKMRLGWNARNSFIDGRYSYRIQRVDEVGFLAGISSLIRLFARSLLLLTSIGWGMMFRDRSEFPFVQNHIFECSLPILVDMGFRFEQFITLLSGLSPKKS